MFGALLLAAIGIAVERLSPEPTNEALIVLPIILILLFYISRLRCPQCDHPVNKGRANWRFETSPLCQKCGYDLRKISN